MLKLLTLLGLFLTLQTQAAQMDFSPAEFKKAQSEGKQIVLQFHADWCPVCVKQQKEIKSISMEKSQGSVAFLKADYDSEKELKKKLGVKGQSTLIFYRGDKEVARSQGVTERAAIEADIRKTEAM